MHDPHHPVVVHLDGVVIGPEQWLVLCSRQPLTQEEISIIQQQMPPALHHRVLVASDMQGFVVEGSDV